MNVKRLFKGPIPYLIIAALVFWIGISLMSMNGFREVSTQEGLAFLEKGQVKEAVITDGDQRVDLTLTKADDEFGKQVQFYYVGARAADVVEAVDAADPSGGYNDKVPQPSWLLSMLGLLLPLLLIGVFFWLMLSGMQGGGNKVMQFGKSKAKLVSKESPKVTFDDVAGADEAIE
ncbi:MAG: ATP-dependent metallopeptidase FtsH/Yme1/Tma family protein, partial [Plantibacter flavus]